MVGVVEYARTSTIVSTAYHCRVSLLHHFGAGEVNFLAWHTHILR